MKIQALKDMNYKGYTGVLIYDDEAGIFSGKVAYLRRDAITFQGTSVTEMQQAFEDSVNDYLEWCEERGTNPEKPYNLDEGFPPLPKKIKEMISSTEQDDSVYASSKKNNKKHMI